MIAMLFMMFQSAFASDWAPPVASGAAVAAVFAAYTRLVADVRRESRERESRALDVLAANTAAIAASAEVGRETAIALRELRDVMLDR